MAETYKIEDLSFVAYGTWVKTGDFIKNRNGRWVAKTKYQEFYKTSVGTFPSQEWRDKAMEAVEAAGEITLLEAVKDHCRKYCAWLHKESDIEEYALECMTHRSYLHWDDFQTKEKEIFFIG